MNKKTVKAWAAPNLYGNLGKCIDKFTNKMPFSIYANMKEAKEANGGERAGLIRCTITYSLPSKRKSK